MVLPEDLSPQAVDRKAEAVSPVLRVEDLTVTIAPRTGEFLKAVRAAGLSLVDLGRATEHTAQVMASLSDEVQRAQEARLDATRHTIQLIAARVDARSIVRAGLVEAYPELAQVAYGRGL